MRTVHPLSLVVGLALGLAVEVSAQSDGPASIPAEHREIDTTIQLGASGTVAALRASIKFTGKVIGPEGMPAPWVRVSLFPSFSPVEKQTDSEGRFTLTFDPRQLGSFSASQPIVVARDMTNNLAAILELEEGATNASVRLEPALTIAGRITDLSGKAITNGQVRVIFHTERVASNLGSPIRADSEGRFELRALPPRRQYTINASARGFGQEQRILMDLATATNSLELGSFQLMPADLRIAGVVLDDEDIPVARASIYSYGNRQPNLNAQTNAKGQFSMNKVCAGTIQLTANSRNGGYGSYTAEGGETNIVIRLDAPPGMRRAAPKPTSLKGKPLPDLAPLGLAFAESVSDRPLLVVLIDAEQRPSRRTLRLLSEQAATLKAKGTAVFVIQTGTMEDDAFKAWQKEAALPFPACCLKGDAEKARASLGAGALPWIILTDKGHRVVAEGFAIDELDDKLDALAK